MPNESARERVERDFHKLFDSGFSPRGAWETVARSYAEKLEEIGEMANALIKGEYKHSIRRGAFNAIIRKFATLAREEKK